MHLFVRLMPRKGSKFIFFLYCHDNFHGRKIQGKFSSKLSFCFQSIAVIAIDKSLTWECLELAVFEIPHRCYSADLHRSDRLRWSWRLTLNARYLSSPGLGSSADLTALTSLASLSFKLQKLSSKWFFYQELSRSTKNTQTAKLVKIFCENRKLSGINRSGWYHQLATCDLTSENQFRQHKTNLDWVIRSSSRLCFSEKKKRTSVEGVELNKLKGECKCIVWWSGRNGKLVLFVSPAISWFVYKSSDF